MVQTERFANRTARGAAQYLLCEPEYGSKSSFFYPARGGSHDCFPSSRLRPGRRGKVKLIREALKHLIQEMAKEWAPIQYRSKRDGPRWYLQWTSVGVLSAAIWKIGGEALEE